MGKTEKTGMEGYKKALEKALNAYFKREAIALNKDASGNIEAVVSVENGALGYSGAFVVWVRKGVVAVNLFFDGAIEKTEETLSLVNAYNAASVYSRMTLKEDGEKGNSLSLRYYVNGATVSSVRPVLDAFMSEASNGEKTAPVLQAIAQKLK